jgi:hypothetical protein
MIIFLKKKTSALKKNLENLSEPSKPGQRSQTRNPLNSRPKLNQKAQFLIILTWINQSKSNKKATIKKTQENSGYF